MELGTGFIFMIIFIYLFIYFRNKMTFNFKYLLAKDSQGKKWSQGNNQI